MQDCVDDVSALQRLALSFWGEMVECSGNIALQLAFNSLVRSYEGVMDQLQSVLSAEVRAVDEYQAAAHAVANADEESAAEATSAIVARGTVAVEQLLVLLEELQGRQA